MNKKELILTEAKRLSGHYGYLGFTLKQLAQSCDMTAPALYYFYTSKADLFKDCLLSELEIRHPGLQAIADRAQSLEEFASLLADESFEKCEASHFRTGQAMQEIVHLPEEIQADLKAAWERLLISPVVQMLERLEPANAAPVNHMMATFFINMATFAGAYIDAYGRETLRALMVNAATGMRNLHTVQV